VYDSSEAEEEKHIKTFASVMKDSAIDRDTDIFVYAYSLG
jgi:hypothetical protein